MNILEKELEDYLFEKLNKKKFDEIKSSGLKMNYIEKYDYFRQLNLGDYGVSDIVGLRVYADKNKYGNNYAEAIIFELKSGVITDKIISQILRYKSGLESAFICYELACVTLVCIGSSIDRVLEKEMSIMSPYIQCFTYSLSLDGIKFNCNDIIDDPTSDFYKIPHHGDKIESIIEELKLISENERNIINS